MYDLPDALARLNSATFNNTRPNDERTQTNLFSELFHNDLHSFIKLLFGVFLLFFDGVHDA